MTAYSAGQKLAAQDVDQAVTNDVQIIGAAASSLQAMTGSAADIAGTSLSFTTTYANTKVEIKGVFDVDNNGNTTPSAWSVFVGTCVVDGATQSGEAHATGIRVTCSQIWSVTLAAAGSHTIKLQGKSSGGTSGCNTNAVHTKWQAWVSGP